MGNIQKMMSVNYHEIIKEMKSAVMIMEINEMRLGIFYEIPY